MRGFHRGGHKMGVSYKTRRTRKGFHTGGTWEIRLYDRLIWKERGRSTWEVRLDDRLIEEQTGQTRIEQNRECTS